MKLLATLVLLVGLGACYTSGDTPASSRDDDTSIGSAPVTEGPLTIHSAVIPEPTGSDRMSVYAEIRSGGPADTLVGISSGIAAEGSLHDMSDEGGMMTMRPADAFPVPDGGTLSLRSGARHGMLEALKHVPAAGEAVSVVFAFASGAEITVFVPVVPLAALVEGGERRGR